MAEVQSIIWDEVRSAADKMFNVWTFGREVEWAELAWQGLAASGLTTYRDEVDKSLVKIRLAVLGIFYREFCTQAWDEWDEPQVKYWLEDLDLNPFRIAQIVGAKFHPHHGSSTQEELFEAALEHLIEETRPSVFGALMKHFGGESLLFASMWATNVDLDEDEDDGGDDDRPGLTLRDVLDSDIVLDRILNGQDYMWEERLRAFEWVREGMPSVNFQRAEHDV